MIEGIPRRATKLMVGSKLSYSDLLFKTWICFSYLNVYTVVMALMCLVIYNFMNSNMNLII